MAAESKRLLMRARHALLIAAACAALASDAHAQSSWVRTGSTGRLIYVPDADGDRIADFSMVGYGAGRQPIPSRVPTVIRIEPIAGDNTQHIQQAIDHAASLPLGPGGFRGAVELAPGKFDVHGRLNITASGIVLRGSGAGDDLATNTHIVSQNRTDSMSSASTPVINISGSSSGISRGPQVQIIDKRVAVGAQSFRVASTAGLSVGGMVEIFRPSTQNWIEDLGMHLMPNGDAWEAGDQALRWHRTVTRIEGDRVFVDAPITTALDVEYGGGTVRTYNAPNVIHNVGVENLRGQSLDAREESNEQRTPTFVRFSRVQDGYVQNVETRHFPYASVYALEADGTQHITVDNVNSFLPSGQVTGGRRYSFAMDAQYSLVKNAHADSGRHDYVTGSAVTGPIVFYNSSTSNTRSDTGPHHRWGNGLLFDNVDVNGHAINVQNRWTSGSGHGWAGANVVIWNSEANSFIVQNPPTAQNWLIGSSGTINPGNCHLDGAACPGYYESHGARVTVGGAESLYEAQVNDAADIREFHWTGGDGQWSDAIPWDQSAMPAVYRISHRDYFLGDIDSFVHDGQASVDNAYVDPDFAAAIVQQHDLRVTGFDDLGGNRHAAFTVQHQLDPGERVLNATLAMSLQGSNAGSAANDFLQLFDTDPQRRLTFQQLGWHEQINGTTPFVGVVDLAPYLARLQSGEMNVQLSSQTGLDWAVYTATVATPIADEIGPFVYLDRGGSVTLDFVPTSLGHLQIGGGDGGQLALTSDARLAVQGDVVQLANGVLQLELDGDDRRTPKIAIGGQAQLAGALHISMSDSWVPQAGEAVVLVTAEGGIVELFENLVLPPIPSGLEWNLGHTADSVFLQVVSSALLGDYNSDGRVDAADYIVWRKTGINGPQGYLDWRVNFGQEADINSSSAEVPEPTAQLLLGCYSGWLPLFRRQRRLGKASPPVFTPYSTSFHRLSESGRPARFKSRP